MMRKVLSYGISMTILLNTLSSSFASTRECLPNLLEFLQKTYPLNKDPLEKKDSTLAVAILIKEYEELLSQINVLFHRPVLKDELQRLLATWLEENRTPFTQSSIGKMIETPGYNFFKNLEIDLFSARDEFVQVLFLMGSNAWAHFEQMPRSVLVLPLAYMQSLATNDKEDILLDIWNGISSVNSHNRPYLDALLKEANQFIPISFLGASEKIINVKNQNLNLTRYLLEVLRSQDRTQVKSFFPKDRFVFNTLNIMYGKTNFLSKFQLKKTLEMINLNLNNIQYFKRMQENKDAFHADVIKCTGTFLESCCGCIAIPFFAMLLTAAVFLLKGLVLDLKNLIFGSEDAKIDAVGGDTGLETAPSLP